MKLSMMLAALGAAALATDAIAQDTIDPAATLEISDLNEGVNDAHSPPLQFDLNDDGFNDFEIQIGNLDFPEEDGIGGEFAIISGLSNFLQNGTFTGGTILVSNDEFMTDPHTSFPAVETLSEGEQVTLDLFEGFSFAEEGILFAGRDGPFSVGETAFIGLQLSVLDESTEGESSFLGWAEITRGSIEVGQIGFQTEEGLEAPIPVTGVPVPPAFAMFAGALALFGFVARRKRQAGRA